MNKRKYIYHIEFLISIILLICILYAEITRDISVEVEADDSIIQEANTTLVSEVDQLESLYWLYELNLKELRIASVDGGLDRLSSEEAIVGRVFHVEGEPYYYYLTLQEYLEAKYNILPDSSFSTYKGYIRPLTPDIEFLARQFVERYEDKTDRAIAILSLIHNLEYNENEDVIKHPTETLMKGGSSIDLTIACGALLKAADIDCAILIFKDQRHATIGISGIEFEKFNKDNKNVIIEYEGKKYLICNIVLPQNLKGSKLEELQNSVTSETIAFIIPYEFP